MPKRLLRPAETWAKLGIKHTKYYAMREAGKIRPPVRLGPQIVAHPEDEIDALIGQLIAERDAAEAPPTKPESKPRRKRSAR